ncbi:hypothetical protein BAUCODRAFT_25251 [Baudoinia panamericana UAMH 10762]|uniref:Uncharacterized protein n=1 Tax=Baudoinia panamericana (strain UAMH 10762) TaxID=717646 RepID=M2N8J2_BAUPA|nr:uncharacterized protein BAUCODRAFT_25251 [Baudoinia panamericana UAMH 10762]EMC95150.1 hypothetical protein BAUCODRAFT_25251 [Baudoinia panamericana UAMH 10762]
MPPSANRRNGSRFYTQQVPMPKHEKFPSQHCQLASGNGRLPSTPASESGWQFAQLGRNSRTPALQEATHLEVIQYAGGTSPESKQSRSENPNERHRLAAAAIRHLLRDAKPSRKPHIQKQLAIRFACRLRLRGLVMPSLVMNGTQSGATRLAVDIWQNLTYRRQPALDRNPGRPVREPRPSGYSPETAGRLRDMRRNPNVADNAGGARYSGCGGRRDSGRRVGEGPGDISWSGKGGACDAGKHGGEGSGHGWHGVDGRCGSGAGLGGIGGYGGDGGYDTGGHGLHGPDQNFGGGGGHGIGRPSFDPDQSAHHQAPLAHHNRAQATATPQQPVFYYQETNSPTINIGPQVQYAPQCTDSLSFQPDFSDSHQHMPQSILSMHDSAPRY